MNDHPIDPATAVVQMEIQGHGSHERPPGRTKMSLNKTELVAKVAAETGQSQAAVSAVLDGIFSAVSETVAAGGKVSIPGWLAFEVKSTAARTGRNPRTGEAIEIPAGKRVSVTAGSKLKAAVK